MIWCSLLFFITALPEFVPFNDKDFEVNISPRKSNSNISTMRRRSPSPANRNPERGISPSATSLRRRTPSPANRNQKRGIHPSATSFRRRSPSPDYRNKERGISPSATSLRRRTPTLASRNPECQNVYSSEHQCRSSHTINGNMHPLRPESSRSPHRGKSSPRRNERNRSRSPNYNIATTFNEAPERREQHARIEYFKTTERLSSETNRQGSSVFDRMSNPPVRKSAEIRRMYTEDRRSIASNGTIVRRVSNQIEPIYYSTEQALDMETMPLTYQRSRSPIREQINFIEQIRVEANHIPDVTDSIIFDESQELRELRNRLAKAETHCAGLEVTVFSYIREIQKLRHIVNSLTEDLNNISKRFR